MAFFFWVRYKDNLPSGDTYRYIVKQKKTHIIQHDYTLITDCDLEYPGAQQGSL